MRILVFGATGGTGTCLLDQAITRGHEVTAFVRDPSRLTADSDSVHVVRGDMLEPASLAPAFDGGQDAVISALGVFHRNDSTELSRGTRNILKAMAEQSCDRLVVISSLGAGDSAGQGNWFARLIQRLLLQQVLNDKTRQEELVEFSPFDYTIVRPPQLVDKPTLEKELCVWQGLPPQGERLSWRTSRASLASFVLDCLEQRLYIRETVNISERR